MLPWEWEWLGADGAVVGGAVVVDGAEELDEDGDSAELELELELELVESELDPADELPEELPDELVDAAARLSVL